MSFFDNEDDDEESPFRTRHPVRPAPAGQPTAVSAFASGSRSASTFEYASRPAAGAGVGDEAGGGGASSSRYRASSLVSATESGGGSRSFLSRLESTVSPNGKSRAGTEYDYAGGLGAGDGMLGDDDDDYRAGAGAGAGVGAGVGVGGGNRRRRVRGGGMGGGDDAEVGDEDEDEDEDEEEALDDVERMGKVWVRERGTVDIMRWEGDLIDTLFDKLEQQAKMVTTLRSDPQTSKEEHFKLVLVQTEMERVKFLVRAYVRARLAKIEKYSHYIVLHPETHQLLSGAELLHARRYTELLHTHFQHSVLDSLPEWLRKMDDSYGDGLSMGESVV